MASKRKRQCVGKRPNLFDEDQDLDGSHDPFSDEDGEYGSDGNYEPENGDNLEDDSDSDFSIFPTRTKIEAMPSRAPENDSQSEGSVSDPEAEIGSEVDETDLDGCSDPEDQGSGSAERAVDGGGSPDPENNGSGSAERAVDGGGSPDPEDHGSSSAQRAVDGGGSPDTEDHGNGSAESAVDGGGSPDPQNNGSGSVECAIDGGGSPDPEDHGSSSAQRAVDGGGSGSAPYMSENSSSNSQVNMNRTENVARSRTPLPIEEWDETVSDIPIFNFDSRNSGPTSHIDENTTPTELFDIMFTPDNIEYLVERTNAYGNNLANQARPHTRNSRHKIFRPTNAEEMKKFLGLSLLQGHIDIPDKRKLFTVKDPLYYHPIFGHVMSGRRYEQLLRCLCVSQLDAQGSAKIDEFINMLTRNFRNALNPGKELSLDESLLLFRGRLVFRTYMKNKKTKYGIKFYVLCTDDGYVLNIKMYSGRDDVQETNEGGPKLTKLVLRLMRPYLMKGHELYMDRFYNSVPLSEKLLDLKTHTNGTLRSNRKGNPTLLVKKKLKKGEHFWLRKNKVYVSHWKDKRQVLMLTTLDHPEMVEVTNKRGEKLKKPKEVVRYNMHMSGIDRADQMISYYSSPRKTIRWYKKVIFHMLDTAVWNAFYLYKKYVKPGTKCEFIEFRENLIRDLTKINKELTGKDLQMNVQPERTENSGHWPIRIPAIASSKKKFAFLNCRVCQTRDIRRETSYRCKGCPQSPPLCPTCFEEWHQNLHN